MKILAAALLSLAVSAAPAGAATFTAPRSLTGWGTYADQPVAARGAAAWLQRGDVWLSRGGRAPIRLPADGAQQVRVATADGRETEILFPYGGTLFASKMGQLAGNHFLTITSGAEQLRELGRTVLWEGALDIAFDNK